jgi:hypothetical protein
MKESATKTYWPAVPLLLVAGFSFLGFFVVGLTMVFSYFQDSKSMGGVSGLVIGIMVCAFAVLLGRQLIESKLVVTSAGISVSRRMRRKMISWDSIKSFEIGQAPSSPILLTVVVILESEKIPIRATAGFGKRVNAIMADLTAARQRHLDNNQPHY